MEDESGLEVQVPIDWQIPENITAKYVTHFVVQHSVQEFTLSFFEAQPPIIFGERHEVEAKAREIKSIPAKCVARIVVTPAKMETLIEVLQENVANYKARFEAKE